MGKLRDILFTPIGRKAKPVVGDSGKEIETKLKPVHEIERLILKTTGTCFQGVKPVIKLPEGKEKQEAETAVFFAFLFFFMHLTLRLASARLNPQQTGNLHRHLGRVIPSVAVVTFFPHMPEELKERSTHDFLGNLDKAELE